MKNIFISYRREDTEGFARGLFQSLEGAFGSDHVFMDVEAIGLGVDFVEAIDKSLASCGALLVLIGRDWVNCTDSAGRRRLDDPQDFVRMEVAKALEQNVRVIPVLVKGARMPAPEDLPELLRSVTRRQALELRHERWSQDVEHLASALAQMLELPRLDRSAPAPPMPPRPASPNRTGRRMVMGLVAVALLAVLAVAGHLLIPGSSAPPVVVDSESAVQQEADKGSSPAPVSIAPSEKGEASGSENAAAPQPKPEPTPPPAPRVQKSIDLTGMWVDHEGVNVQISQQGNEVVSQAYNPLTGLSVNAVWQVSGRRIAFNWASNAGNQGYGEGSIAADGATVDYQFVDHVTGEQGYGRLFRLPR
jgi:cytoskeletal protein RodZ